MSRTTTCSQIFLNILLCCQDISIYVRQYVYLRSEGKSLPGDWACQTDKTTSGTTILQAALLNPDMCNPDFRLNQTDWSLPVHIIPRLITRIFA